MSTASKHSRNKNRQDCSATPSTNQDLKAYTLTKILVLYLALNGTLKVLFRFRRFFFLIFLLGIASITYINTLQMVTFNRSKDFEILLSRWHKEQNKEVL